MSPQQRYCAWFCTLLIALGSLYFGVLPGFARVVFKSEFVSDQEDNTFVIDKFNDASGNIALQFGASLGESISYDTGNNWFSFSNDVNFNQHELLEVVFEKRTTAPPSPVSGQIYHNTVDNNTYVYNGTTWEDITAVSSTSSKVVTVGTGLDYASIEDAAGYLNSLSGGMILLSAEVHNITTSVDLQNITLIGKDPTQTTIQISGGGQIDAFDTRFVNLSLDINSITDDMAIDVQTGSNSLRFEYVSIDIQDSGDVLIDSNAGSPPTSTISFISCDAGGNGSIVKAIAPANLDAASNIFISGASGNSLLKLNDWNVTIEGAGNVVTSGTISTVPSDTIYVYPGMNIQAAINSLPNGGSITLLSGTHTIGAPLIIANDNVEIAGYGDASIIAASGFTGITNQTAAIQVGAANGSDPSNGVKLSNFQLQVSSNIHGIRVAGGEDNQVSGVTVKKQSGQSGTAATANIAIQLLDGTALPLIRPMVQNCVIQGNGGTTYFTDGIHVTSEAAVAGVFGNGIGVREALIEGNNVDYVRETGYVFYGVDNSSLFNNRASRMGAGGGGAYGIFMGDVTNVNMTANIFSGSLSTASIAIGIESFNTGSSRSTVDSIFANNVIDGLGNSGVGFGTGFQMGAATNTIVSRNIFMNNTIKGASNAVTVAIDVRGDADGNVFSSNLFTGGTNPWDTGIHLQAAAQEQNIIVDNNFSNVTVQVSDTGTNTTRSVRHVERTANPTANDDRNDGLYIGFVWVNTTADTSYMLMDDTVGAAVWKQIDNTAGGAITGVDSNTFTIDQDNTGGNMSLVFGTALNERLTWNNTAGQFELTDDLVVLDDTITLGTGGAADATVVFNDGTNRSFGWDDSEDSFSTFNEQMLLRVRQGGTIPFACNSAVQGTLFQNTSNGELYLCDASSGRNKWLSVTTQTLWGETTATCNSGSDVNSSAGCNVNWGGSLGPDGGTDLGFYIPFNATIVGYGFSADNDACTSGSFDVEVWGTSSNSDDNGYSLLTTVASGLNNQAHNSNTLNLDIDGDQYIIWGLDNNCGQNIDDWNVVLYLRWRS